MAPRPLRLNRWLGCRRCLQREQVKSVVVAAARAAVARAAVVVAMVAVAQTERAASVPAAAARGQ